MIEYILREWLESLLTGVECSDAVVIHLEDIGTNKLVASENHRAVD